jgi:hypothetical protein
MEPPGVSVPEAELCAEIEVVMISSDTKVTTSIAILLRG